MQDYAMKRDALRIIREIWYDLGRSHAGFVMPEPAALPRCFEPRETLMINIAAETILTLSEVPNTLKVARRGGKKLAVSTVFRWARGLRGVRLETIRIGGGLCTSAEALQRFFDRLSGAEAEASSGSIAGAVAETPSSRRRAIAAADRELDRLGV